MATSSLESIVVTSSDLPEFVALEERHRCPVCHNALQEAIQTSCGHRYCKNCVDRKFEQEGFFLCVEDPDCGKLTRELITPDFSARKEIKNLRVYCTYRKFGCETVVVWRNLSAHILKCLFIPVKCPYRPDGCQELLSDREVDEHVTTHCKFRPADCEFCHLLFPLSKLKIHQDQECPAVLVYCPHRCTEQKIPRGELNSHLQVCTRKPQHCKYRGIGCQFQDVSEKIGIHESECVSVHLDLLMAFASNLQEQHAEMAHALERLQTDKESFLTDIRQINTKNSELRQKMQADVDMYHHFQRKMRDLETRIATREQTVAGMDNAGAVADELVALNAMANLIRQQLDTYNENRNAMPGEFTSQMNEVRAQIEFQKRTLNTYDETFKSLEKTSYDGSMIWRIDNYQRSKALAISGEQVSILSPPFMTHTTGYNMAAKAYLNGDGIGNGTHLSLFVVIKKGDHDEILKWPFTSKITFAVMNQESKIKERIEYLHPDPNSSSYQRPTREANTASGLPLFLPQATLEAGNKYIRDDTLFIFMCVDMNTVFTPTAS